MTSFATTSDLPAPSMSAARLGSRLLLINGVVLGVTAFAAAMFDLAGTFLNSGPMAAALAGNPSAIGFFEAHGLALIVAILIIVNRNADGAKWHWVAAATHLLLGGANLMFWSSFTTFGLVPMGVVATVLHAVFLVAELAAGFIRTPEILTGPGRTFRIFGLVTLATGIVLHGSSLPMGREAFVANLFTPLFDAIFAIPMTIAGLAAIWLYRRAIFPNLASRLVYLFIGFYFTISIFIHLRTLFTWDTGYVLVFPAWYPLAAMSLMVALIAFTIRQRFKPLARTK
jgi:hypothetical protein